MNQIYLWVGCFALLTFAAPDSHAELMLQPVSATAQLPMGEFSSLFADGFLVDKSGLSVNYSTGDDLAGYLALNPVGVNGGGTWASTNGNPTGNIDFDLGGSFSVAKMVLWNFAPNHVYNIVGFDLLADDNSAFSSPTSLGSFTADQSIGSAAEVFSFAPTSASFIRMSITSNGGASFTRVYEVAFATSSAAAVPEPSSFAILGIVALGAVRFQRRRRKLGTDFPLH